LSRFINILRGHRLRAFSAVSWLRKPYGRTVTHFGRFCNGSEQVLRSRHEIAENLSKPAENPLTRHRRERFWWGQGAGREARVQELQELRATEWRQTPLLRPALSRAPACMCVATRCRGAPHAWPPSREDRPASPVPIAERRSRLAWGRPALRLRRVLAARRAALAFIRYRLRRPGWRFPARGFPAERAAAVSVATRNAARLAVCEGASLLGSCARVTNWLSTRVGRNPFL
jgi:hypothetical protein